CKSITGRARTSSKQRPRWGCRSHGRAGSTRRRSRSCARSSIRPIADIVEPMRGGLLVLVACGSTTSEPPAKPPPAKPAPVAGGASAPAAACKPGVRVCEDRARDRIGEWRYAVIAPLYSEPEELTRAELVAKWRAGEIEATDETARAVAAMLGPGKPKTI